MGNAWTSHLFYLHLLNLITSNPVFSISVQSLQDLFTQHSHTDGTEQGEGSDKIAWLYNLSAPVKMAMCYFIRSCWDITNMLIIKHVNCKSWNILQILWIVLLIAENWIIDRPENCFMKLLMVGFFFTHFFIYFVWLAECFFLMLKHWMYTPIGPSHKPTNWPVSSQTVQIQDLYLVQN